MSEEEIVIAIDPGTKKCGYAVVDSNLDILQRKIISIDKITDTIENSLNIFKIDKIILGNGTNYKNIEESIKNQFSQLKIILIEEKYSTLKGRKKFFKEHPPRGLLKLIPLSLRVPPGHYDDFVAVLLAEKYFKDSR